MERPIRSSSSFRRWQGDILGTTAAEFSIYGLEDHFPEQAFIGQVDGAQVDDLSRQIPSKVLLTDPLTGGILGALPTQGSLIRLLR